MERNKRIILVSIGIGLLALSAILLIMVSIKTAHKEYITSLEEKEITTVDLSPGDILIIQTKGIDDAISNVKVLDENDDVVVSSKSEIDEGVSIIYTAEEAGEYKIVATLDSPTTEVDGEITISVQHYITVYIILLGILFIFASIMVISSSLLREQYIIPSTVGQDKLKYKTVKSEKKEIAKPAGLTQEDILDKYKTLVEPVGKDIMVAFITKVYRGIADRSDIISAFAIDLKNDEIIWRLSDQQGKESVELLKKPIDLTTNKGLCSIFNKMLTIYGGVFPPQIVLSMPNYYINGLVHKQVMIIILLKPDVDWGISSTIFKK